MLVLAAGGQAQTETAAKPKDAGGEQVCRRGKETGSRLRARRVCHTRDEWEAIDAAHRQTLPNPHTMSRPTG